MRKRSGGIPMPEELVAANFSEADDHIAEERRLMYVALTRSKEDVTLTYALKHHTPTPKKPSRFLAEIENDTKVFVQEEEENATNDLALLTQTNMPTHKLGLPKALYQNNTLRLSVSQIACFLECPLNFYYRYVLNVPEPPNASASYGTAIHGAIEQFNQAVLTGKSVTVDDLHETVQKLWSNAGYLSQEHAEKSRAQALKTIKSFYDTHQNNVPSKIEWPFSVRLEEPGLIIAGRLDAVFESEDFVEIRDYKTSTSVTTEKKAKQRATSSDQLTLYALVWQLLNGSLPNLLTLEFVDTGMIGSIKKTQRGIDGMYAKLQEMVSDIANHNYPPRGEHTFCIHPDIQ